MSVSRPLIFAIIDAPAAALNISAPEKLVLIALVSHMNTARNGAIVWPSQQRLAELTGLGESTVRRVIGSLESEELIKRQASETRHNLYAINSEVIHRLCNTARSERQNPGQNDNTARSERSIPLGASGNTARSERLIAKEQPSGTTNDISSFGCSTSLRLRDGDHQRKLAVHGMIEGAVKRVSTTDPEQPTREKHDTGVAWTG